MFGNMKLSHEGYIKRTSEISWLTLVFPHIIYFSTLYVRTFCYI